MIEKFNNVEMRDSSVIYGSSLKQIKEMYQIDPNTAGELAISIIEVAITGQMSTNNPLIKMALANFEDVANKNKKKWDDKTAKQREARIEKLRLREIAKLLSEGVLQKDIAKIIGKGPSSISDAVRILKTEFPELLEEFASNSEILPKNSVNSENSEEEFGEFDNDSDEFGEIGELNIKQRNSVDSENSPNSEYDNVNDNDNVNENVNVGPFSPSGENFPVVTMQDLEQVKSGYDIDDDGIVTFSTGKKARVKFDFM